MTIMKNGHEDAGSERLSVFMGVYKYDQVPEAKWWWTHKLLDWKDQQNGLIYRDPYHGIFNIVQ